MIATAKRGIPSSYGLVIPMEYDEKDLEDLEHLNDIIGHTRVAVTVITYVWSIDKDFVDREAFCKHFEKLHISL